MRIYNFILLFIIFIVSSCSTKLPVPSSNNTGILVIPVTISNETTADFLYQYTFDYSPQTKVYIKVVPRTGRKFVIVKEFLVGKYKVTAMNLTTGIYITGEPLSSGWKEILPDPFSFDIIPKGISLFPMHMEIRQEWVTVDSVFRQIHRITPMTNAQINKTISDLKNLPNAEFWDFANIPDVSD